MNLYKEIGGYLDLEIDDKDSFIHKNSILLNTARNCLEYILKAKKIKKIFISKYNCEVILEPLKKCGVKYEFYSIDKNFEVIEKINLKDGECLLYVNYFGLKDNYIKKLVKEYSKKLLVDNSQSFYSSVENNISTFYSPRKFFGVPDGGCLYVDKHLTQEFEVDCSYNKFSHLLKRTDLGAEFGYNDFKINDKLLNDQNIKAMSNITKKILNSLNYEKIKTIRLENFKYLHSVLCNKNELKIKPENISCPMVYPFLINNETLREKLIDNKIFIATYWPNIFDWCNTSEIEYYFAKFLLPLPIDQRYNLEDMKIIESVLKK